MRTLPHLGGREGRFKEEASRLGEKSGEEDGRPVHKSICVLFRALNRALHPFRAEALRSSSREHLDSNLSRCRAWGGRFVPHRESICVLILALGTAFYFGLGRVSLHLESICMSRRMIRTSHLASRGLHRKQSLLRIAKGAAAAAGREPLRCPR